MRSRARTLLATLAALAILPGCGRPFFNAPPKPIVTIRAPETPGAVRVFADDSNSRVKEVASVDYRSNALDDLAARIDAVVSHLAWSAAPDSTE